MIETAKAQSTVWCSASAVERQCGLRFGLMVNASTPSVNDHAPEEKRLEGGVQPTFRSLSQRLCRVSRTRVPESSHLLMQRVQAGQFAMRRALGGLEHDRLTPSKHWKIQRMVGRSVGLFELVGDGLAGGGQLLTQAVFGQAVDEQAQHHDQAERHDPLGFLHEDRGGQKQRVFEETEAALHAVLVFVGVDELVVGELRRIEHIGRDQEGGFAPHLPRDGRRVHGSVVRICHSTWSGGASLRGRPGRRAWAA